MQQGCRAPAEPLQNGFCAGIADGILQTDAVRLRRPCRTFCNSAPYPGIIQAHANASPGCLSAATSTQVSSQKSSPKYDASGRCQNDSLCMSLALSSSSVCKATRAFIKGSVTKRPLRSMTPSSCVPCTNTFLELPEMTHILLIESAEQLQSSRWHSIHACSNCVVLACILPGSNLLYVTVAL